MKKTGFPKAAASAFACAALFAAIPLCNAMAATPAKTPATAENATPARNATVSKGVWWWRGGDAADEALAAKRLDFLGARGVTEIYFWPDWKLPFADTRRFVAAAGKRGMRVACLSGDVSWIHPGCRGFAETLEKFTAYQKAAAPGERFYALHLDVEPHQDANLSDERKWQLYADFVLRAAADVHAAGEKIEWDIPFWLDGKRVAYKTKTDVPLLDVLFGCSDCLTLMSYRDTAKAMLDVSKREIETGAERGVRVVLGAETGETGEGSIVTYFEEGEETMERELAKVCEALSKSGLKAGCGVAVHHIGGWEKLAARRKN